MKKALSVLLVLSLLLCFAGCETKSDDSPTVTTTPPIESQTDSWNGLAYQVGSDMEEEFRNDIQVDYHCDGMSLKITRGYLDEGLTSADEVISQISTDIVESGYSCTRGRSNNISYVVAEKGTEMQLYSFYVQGSNVWRMWGVIYNTDEIDDLDATKDRLIEYMTSGTITEKPSSNTGTTTPPVESVDYITVHAYVPDDWASPCCWAWDSVADENVFTSWPGQAMTSSGDHYTIQIPATTNYVIINATSGSDIVQTEDLNIETGREVWLTVDETGDCDISYTEPTTLPDPAPTDDETIMVYAYVPDQWTDPCCWAWNGEENAFALWPGQAMTAGDGVYVIELPAWVDSIIINAKAGTIQTLDLPIEPGKDVWVSIDEDGSIIRFEQ